MYWYVEGRRFLLGNVDRCSSLRLAFSSILVERWYAYFTRNFYLFLYIRITLYYESEWGYSVFLPVAA